MRFMVGADERNDLADLVVAELQRRGHQVELVEPDRWPDVARRVAERVAAGEADQGCSSAGPAPGPLLLPGPRSEIPLPLCLDH
jgi:ribose 5-phosphate isomerase RpiB